MSNSAHFHTAASPFPSSSFALSSPRHNTTTSDNNTFAAATANTATITTTENSISKPSTTSTAPARKASPFNTNNATRPTPILTSRNLALLNSKSGGASCPQAQGPLPAMTSSSSTDLYEAKGTTENNYDIKGTSAPNNRTHHHLQQQQQQNHQPNTSLPSPPLSSMTPTTPYSHLRTNFSPKTFSSPSSPPPTEDPLSLHDRCVSLETELSSLRIQLQHQEQTSTVREKRLSQYQQQSSNTQVSLQTLKYQHELVLAQLSKVQTDSSQLRNQLETTATENKQLKTQAQEQKRELKEVTLDRDSLSLEMVECHSDNAKFLKRLRGSTDQVGSLQDENRSLIEQLRELRARVTELTDDKSNLSETLERERQRTSHATLGLEAVVTRYKGEVERLQDLVLAMGHKHVQTQAQLTYLQKLQQQQRVIQQASESSSLSQRESPSSQQRRPLVSHQHSQSTSSVPHSLSSSLVQLHQTPSQPQQQSLHGGLVLGDGALASILSSVAASSNSRRSKPARRFTVNGAAQQQQQQEAPLTLEQRKCKFLMDQITVLQRGYDNLRQEKITLELQLDQAQRQYEYQQQHRQRRRSSQRRTLGSEQKQLAASSGAAAAPPPVPPIPQQHRHHHQQHQKQPSLSPTIQLPNVSPPHLQTEEEGTPTTGGVTANMTKEEREEAERVQQQIQGALAALESKRKHNNEVPLSRLEELKHLESLKFPQEEVVTTSPPKHLQQQQQQQQKQHYQRELYDLVDWGVQQCSCCIGNLIEI